MDLPEIFSPKATILSILNTFLTYQTLKLVTYFQNELKKAYRRPTGSHTDFVFY